LHVSRLIN